MVECYFWMKSGSDIYLLKESLETISTIPSWVWHPTAPYGIPHFPSTPYYHQLLADNTVLRCFPLRALGQFILQHWRTCTLLNNAPLPGESQLGSDGFEKFLWFAFPPLLKTYIRWWPLSHNPSSWNTWLPVLNQAISLSKRYCVFWLVAALRFSGFFHFTYFLVI